MSKAERCPSWCQDKHDDESGRPLHIRVFGLDARCWVAAIYSEGTPGIDHDVYSVQVNHPGHPTAKLAPREAMNLAKIIESRTHDARVRQLVAAMHRAGELLIAAGAEGPGSGPAAPNTVEH